MKKVLAVLLTIVLLISTASTGAFNTGVAAECAKHAYTNACDTTCNNCGASRSKVTHLYNECFNRYEDNFEYFGEWQIIAAKTGVHVIKSNIRSEDFTYHYLSVTDKNGSEIKFNDSKKGWPLIKDQKYTVRLRCEYNDAPISAISFNAVKLTDNLFPDVSSGLWYSDAAAYVLGLGVMSGYGDTGYFGAGDNIQRQDFMVILAKLDGVDLAQYGSKTSAFSDVPEGSYFEAAVNWGAEKGIVNGYANGKFGTGDKITREQLVKFLYNYANYKDIDTSYKPSTKISTKRNFEDYNQISSWALDSVLWAKENGIISGKTPTTLVPAGNALRCEVAQILFNNYSNNVVPCPKMCIHIFADATCADPQTCTMCGQTKGSPEGHAFLDATCTAPITCSKCGKTRGEPLSHNYVAGECINVANGEVCGDFSESYCPKLYFTGDMSEITKPTQQNKDIECNINVEYRSHDQKFNGAAKIKIQGSSSTRYAKKNYTIKFYKDSTYAKKMKVDVGWGAQNKYCLKANWIDKTHSRNVVTAKLAGEMQSKYGLFESAPNNGAIDGFPVEVYINGEFHGLYTMNIPKDEWQFDMDGDNPDHIVIGGDNWTDPVKFMAIPTDFSGWEVEVGPEDDATLTKVQRLVDFVMNSSDEEFVENFDQYLNLDSTINYYIMMTYAWLPDNYGKNMLLATYDGKVWYPSLYDLDTSWGAHWEGDKLYNYASGVVNGSGSVLWQRVEKHYKKEIAARYFELREDILDPENVIAKFNEFYSTIPAEVLQREYNKWNTAETPIPGYDFTQIEDYLDTVVPRLDARYETWK